MRVFVAIDLDDGIRAAIACFLEGVRGFAPEARWVRPESLHVTLKFIGEKSDEEVKAIKNSLATIQAPAFDLSFRGCGYFPSARSARVFWIGVEADERLNSLAAAVDETLEGLNIPKEEHGYTPHLTLARCGGSRGNRRKRENKTAGTLRHLQEKLEGLPLTDFGAMRASEFCLYQSQVSAGGSKYTKLARFALN